mgnify:CR=1 FL=1
MLYWPSKDVMLEVQKMRCLPANMMAMPSVRGIASTLALAPMLSHGWLQTVEVVGSSLGASFAYSVSLGLEGCLEGCRGAFSLDARSLPSPRSGIHDTNNNLQR